MTRSILVGSVIAALASLAVPATVTAQTSSNMLRAPLEREQAPRVRLDLQRALEMAEIQNPQVLEAEAEREASEAGVAEARAPFWPTLSATFNVERTTLNASNPTDALPFLDFSVLDPSLGPVPVGNPERDLSGFTRFTAALNAEYILLDFGRREAGLTSAQRERDVFGARRDSTANDRILDAGIAYFEVLKLEGLTGVREEAVTRQRESLELAERLLRAGRGTAGDTARARADLASSEVDLLRARNNLDTARLQLTKAMGVDDARFRFELVSSSRVRPPAEFLNGEPDSQMLDAHPSRVAQERLIEARDAQVRQRVADRYPTLRLLANYNVQRFDEGGGTAPNYSVGVQLRWDLADGGARSARIAEARAQQSAERQRARDVNQTLVTELSEADLTAKETTARIELATQALEASAEDLRLARSGYREGIRTILDLSLAETSFQEMAEQLVSAEFERQQALLRIYWAVGQLDSQVSRTR